MSNLPYEVVVGAAEERMPSLRISEEAQWSQWDLEWIYAEYEELRDLPVAVLTSIGCYDLDCAGGCG